MRQSVVRSRSVARVSLALATLASALLLALASFASDSADAAAIVARAFDNLYGFSSIQRVEVRSRSGEDRELRRTVQVARSPSSNRLNRMLMRFLGPGDLRGVSVLLLERQDLGYDAFLFQPALQRVRRISVAHRNDPFFGTDVSLEDLEAKRADQWSIRFIGKARLHERNASKIELTPIDARSTYERIVAWFDDELPIMLRADCFRGDERVKRLEIDASRVERIGDYFVPRRLTFQRDQSVTTVEIADVELREDLPDELFTRTTLELGDDVTDARPR